MQTQQTARWLALATLILTFPAYGHAQSKGRTALEKWDNLYEPYADDKMPYRLMKPLGFEAHHSYPLIVSLHGGGGKGTDNRKQLKAWNKQLAGKDLSRTPAPSRSGGDRNGPTSRPARDLASAAEPGAFPVHAR